MGFRPGSTMPSATPYSNFPSKQKRFLLLKNCWESDMSVRSCKRQSISSRQETLEFPRGCFHAAGEGPWTDELALRDLRSTSLKQAPPPTAQLHSPVQKLQDGVRWHSPCPWSKPICSSSPSASKFSHKESPFQTSGLGLGWALSLCLSKAPLRRNLHVSVWLVSYSFVFFTPFSSLMCCVRLKSFQAENNETMLLPSFFVCLFVF